MKKIHYIKLHNFKVFAEEIHIDIDQPTVLIGPNNSGKTTILQALTIWGLGLKTWYERRGSSKAKTTLSTRLNRLNIIQVPVQETRYFWKNANIRKGNDPIVMDITVGLEYQGKVEECSLIFKYQNPEVIYCSPSEKTLNVEGLIEYASKINIELLYPMSGIETEEPLIQEGRINVLLGQGQTAQVLRNLCYMVIENDRKNETDDWEKITELMRKLFLIELRLPEFNEARGTVELKYTPTNEKSHYAFDIMLSGRGQQQMLLLIAYIFSHKNTILLIDEPDAHLEILRQIQIFSILKELAEENGNQIIIATHSEVILDDAIDTNLTMLIDGQPINATKKSNIRNALKNFGIEHYYKAKVKKSVLYVEGSSDIEMLKEFAKKLNHVESLNILNSNINYYYTRDVEPEDTLNKKLDISTGFYQNYKKHYNAVKSCVDGFKGIAVFDDDGRDKQDEIENDFAIVYWKKYELENYFITPDLIEMFAQDHYSNIPELFAQPYLNKLKRIIDEETKRYIFNNNEKAFNEYINMPPETKKVMFNNLAIKKKMSLFLENVLKEFSRQIKQPILINKGQFSQLIQYCSPEDIDPEIEEKLNLICQYLG